jgi:hypothetical protein
MYSCVWVGGWESTNSFCLSEGRTKFVDIWKQKKKKKNSREYLEENLPYNWRKL